MSLSTGAVVAADVPALAAALAPLPLLRRYGVNEGKLQGMLAAAHARGEVLLWARALGATAPCGLAWGMARGGLGSGGYLRLLLVAENSWGQGVGSGLLAAFEAACGDPPGGFFVLTEQQGGAASFYGRHGYRPVGPLVDFVRPGQTELLLHKRT